jgi:ribosomal protein S18 acetylase RimI-like enzyme
MERLRQEQGTVLFTTALINEAGLMIGHSNVLFVGAAPAAAYQAMTGIDAAYRGRGLARWLKAELITRIGEKYPGIESLVTEMRSINEPIQAINRQLGYEIEARGHEMELPVAAVRDFVARNVRE